MVHELAQERQRDDLAVVAGRLTRAQPDSFSRRIRADVREARDLRHAFRSWVVQIGFDAEVESGLVLAVGEAVANAVEHAYASAEPGFVVVEAGTGDGVLRVEVHDHGTWRPPVDDETRGRGFVLMRGLTAELDVRSGEQGTTVVLTHPLPGGGPEERRRS